MAKKRSFRNAGKFVLRMDGKSNPQGEYPLYLQYCLDGKVAKCGTGVWLKEKDWSIEKQKVLSSHSMADKLNQIIDNQKIAIDVAILEYLNDGNRLTIEVLRQMVSGTFSLKKEKDPDFIKFTDSFLEDRYRTSKNGISTFENQRSAMRNFKRFIKREYKQDILPFSQLTESVIDKYIIWRKEERENCAATINKSLTPIINSCKSAAVKGYISHELVDILSLKYLGENKKMSSEEKEDNNASHYLTDEQLKQLRTLTESIKHPRTLDYIDMFLFSVCACGLRFSDILTLEWRHINFETHHLKKILVKGRTPHKFFLNTGAEKILYKWKDRTGNNRFVFGLLPDDFDIDDERELRRMRMNKNTPVKTSLKTIGRKMGLPFNLTMHVARHTFAVAAINRGVDIHIISTLLAHSSILVTEKVYAKFLPKTLDDEIRDKLDFEVD